MENQQNFNSEENNYFSKAPEQSNQGFSSDSAYTSENSGSANYYQQGQRNGTFQGNSYQSGVYQSTGQHGMGQHGMGQHGMGQYGMGQYGMGQQGINQPQPQYYNNAYSQGNYPPAGQPYAQQGQVPEEISVLQYLGMMWIGMVPFVGLIMMLVWAFSGDQVNRRNYARAILINGVISLVLVMLSWGFLVTIMYQIINSTQY